MKTVNIKHNKGKKIAMLTAALVILYLIIYVAPSLIGWLAPTEQIEKGTLQVTDEVDCFFVRHEKVYTAPDGGDVTYKKDEGEKVGKGVQVVEFEATGEKLDEGETSEYQSLMTRLGKDGTKTRDGRTTMAGIVSYSVDGYERKLTRKTMYEMNEGEYNAILEKPSDVRHENAFKAEPLFKVCDNQAWYLVFWINTEGITKYEKGNEVEVSIGDDKVNAEVHRIIDEDGKWRVVLRCRNYCKDFATLRHEEVTVKSNDYSGLLVTNSNITTEDGKPGVMVKQTDGEYRFVRVKIVASDGERSVVAADSFVDEEGLLVDTVGAYDEIEKNPKSGT